MKKSSKITIAVLAVVIALGFVYILFDNATKERRAELDRIETVTLKKGNLEKIVIADGKIRSEKYTQIYPTTAGVVKVRNVSEGDTVSVDDVIMELETTDQFGETETQEITAPIDGTITNIWAKLESHVSQAQRNPLIEIVDLDALEIEGFVIESDLDVVDVGQKVKLDFPALNGLQESSSYTGKVAFIAESPNDLSAANPVYRMVVSPDELPDEIAFGMTVNMEIVTDERKSVLNVDNVYILSEKGKDYITELVDFESGKTENREVTLGFEGENETEIISGVKVGTKVVLPLIKSSNGIQQPLFFGGGEE